MRYVMSDLPLNQQNFWTTALHHLKKKEPVFLAWVVEHFRHASGTTGNYMLISPSGYIEGTVGGGSVEYRMVEYAREALSSSSFIPEIQTLIHEHTGPDGTRSKGGKQTNLYMVCLPQRYIETVRHIVSCLQQEQPAVLRIDPSGLSLSGEADWKQRKTGLIRSGSNWVYEEVLLNKRRMAIIGGGHCALALSRTMRFLGYHVTIYDTRPDLQTVQRNQWAQTTIVENYRDAGRMIRFPEYTFAVVMTADVDTDVQGLLGVLSQDVRFVGAMGSKAKIAFIKQHLRKAGIPESSIDRLWAPVGLSIGSKTPEEIAISIAAQVIRNQGRA